MSVLSASPEKTKARFRKLGPHRSSKGILSWDDEPFRRFFEKSPIPMMIDDIHQSRGPKICLQINDSFKKLFGYSLKESRNLNGWFRRAFPDLQYRKKTIRKWEQDIRRARRNGGVMPLVQHRVRTKDGRDVEVELGGVILGEYLLTTFTDLNKRVRTEKQLAESESLFRMIFEKMPAPAAHVDFGSKDYGKNPVFFTNQAVHQVFGYTKKELTNVEAWMIRAYPDPVYRKTMHDKFFGQLARLKNVGDILKPMEFEMRCKDGGVKHMLWTGFKMPRGFFALSTDLTEVRQAQADLRVAEENLRKLARQEAQRLQQKLQTSVVASAVAHEVNQPLSEILIKSQLALQQAESFPQLPVSLRDTLRSLVEDSRRVDRTIERMRALLRNVPTQLISTDLRECVDSSILYLKRVMSEGKIRLQSNLPKKPVRVLGDSSQLQLAVTNLLRNATETIQESGCRNRKISIQLGANRTHAEIIVGDSGPGLAPHIRQQIFSVLTSNRPKGTGLGLYLVRTTVVNHGGEVSVGDSPLGGAEFRVRIPLELPGRLTKNGSS
ncbi:MAG: PAS domain-containing sensor histidine kinase [Candidatus Pacebacteria bacterium]|nr:PAS domain-containing sensor histidine kinase [Candidatus Paceibacterota bacterium]